MSPSAYTLGCPAIWTGSWGRSLHAVSARFYVFASGDPGIELLRIQSGSAVQRLRDPCRVHIIDSADHTFTQSGTRAALAQVLRDELFARHGRT